MKSEKAIRQEMMRCKREKDRCEEIALETGEIPKDFDGYHIRYWALRWVLNTSGPRKSSAQQDGIKSEKEVVLEMMRCKKLRDKYEQKSLEEGIIDSNYKRHNIRYWTMRWVLDAQWPEDEEALVDGVEVDL